MADAGITAANVLTTLTTQIARGVAGAAITAGQPLYADATANNVLKLAQADTAAHAACVGIALHAAAIGQPIAYATGGALTVNAVLGVGKNYVVSANAGGLAPTADLDGTSGTNFSTIIGDATTTTNLQINILASGVVKA